MARKIYSVLGVLLLIELGLQFFFIAVAAMNVWGAKDNAGAVYSAFKTGDTFAGLHAANGDLVIPVTILLMIALAFAARHPARVKGQTAGLFGLLVLQFLLAGIGRAGSGAAILGGLHGLNALVIVGLTVAVVRATWAFGRASAGAVTAAGMTAEAAP